MATKLSGGNGRLEQSPAGTAFRGPGEEAEVGEAASRAREMARAVYERLDLAGRVRRHPYGMVAGALGLGFLLRGGLGTRVGIRLLGLGASAGLRLVLLPVLADELQVIVQRLSFGSSEKAASGGQKQGGIA